MPRIAGEQSDGVQAVVLVLRILEHLAQSGREVGVTALAESLGTTKSRIHRHLQTLVAQGYVARSPESERYRTGTSLVVLGMQVAGKLDLATAAMPVLHALREALGHSAVVSRVEEDGIRVLATIASKSQIEIGVRPGSLLSFHGSAQGKVALAFGPESRRSRVLRSRLDMLTPRTIVSATVLQRELDEIRRRGWAVAPNETLLGLNTLAAPVFNGAGELVGTVGLNDSIQFIEAEPSEEQIERIVAAGRAVSAELGFSAPV